MKAKSGTILVVDDSRLIRKMLSKQLERVDYKTDTAEDGENALKLIERNAYDAVLLDIVMPGIDGLETLKKIRKAHTVTDLPVIMVTSKDDSQAIVDALNLGANDYITKPVDRAVVLARLNTHLTLKRNSKALEESNNLKDLFIDIMGHDLLKPAEVARLCSEMMFDEEEDTSKKELLLRIIKSHNKIIELLENASLLAKLEAGGKLEFNEGDVGEILRSATDDMKGSAAVKNIELRVEVPEKCGAKINPLIYDVFTNLIGNAIKYGPESSEVVASIANGNREFWRISVSDTGGGIPDEYKDAIFDRFKRFEKGGVKGSGLGLAIVKRVVLAHSGKVWVEDNNGGGSIFNVEIPKIKN